VATITFSDGLVAPNTPSAASGLKSAHRAFHGFSLPRVLIAFLSFNRSKANASGHQILISSEAISSGNTHRRREPFVLTGRERSTSRVTVRHATEAQRAPASWTRGRVIAHIDSGRSAEGVVKGL
jgi:hypothetical protein